jgi:hypothetical protein
MKIGGTTQKNKSKFSNLSKQYSNLHHGTLIDVQEKKKGKREVSSSICLSFANKHSKPTHVE